MGDLIQMTRPTASSLVRMPAGASAEILFFTGVRYYRAPEVDSVKPRRQRPPKLVRRATSLDRHA